MKKILIINPHSFIDVITNSSTELFVCDTDKTVEMVKEILAGDPNVYGYQEPWVFNLKEYREWRKKEREVIANWIQGVTIHGDFDNPFHCIQGWFYDTEDEEDIEYLRKRYIEDGDRKSLDRNPFSNRLHDAEDKAAKITKLSVNNDKRWRVRADAREAEIDKIYKETESLEEKPDWWVNPLKYYYNDQPVNDLDGKIMIIGEDDNSIPYDHFDWIENVFNATRHHLG